MKIFCCQLDIIWENKPANYAKVLALLEGMAPEAGSLVILPEMFSTGFSMNVEAISDSRTRETEMFLAATASKYDIFLLGGLVTTAPDGRGRNEAVAFSPEGREVGRYRKMHPFTFGGESQHYVGGKDPLLFQWHNIVVSPFICYDLRFPEVFRAAVQEGTQFFVVIANWPAARESHWLTLLKARAIENQSYVAGVNRCGNDPKLAYSGRSLIVDPRGEVIADAGGEEGIISAEVDVEALFAYRHDFPVLDDIHPQYVRLPEIV
jgi:omega-amidase